MAEEKDLQATEEVQVEETKEEAKTEEVVAEETKVEEVKKESKPAPAKKAAPKKAAPKKSGALKGQDLIRELTKSYLKDVPEFRAGDTLKVHVNIVEGSKSRVQIFEGLVIKRQGGGISETFTVRKISNGVGVERTFPVHSPSIAKIDVVKKGKVRRARLHYIRTLSAKKARIKERR